MRKILCVLVLLVQSYSPNVCLAQSGTISVDARSNIFGAGSLSNPTPAPGGGGGGLPAPHVSLLEGVNRIATLHATGLAGWFHELNNGPDGGTFAISTNIPSVGGISGFRAPLSGHLVGVFLDSNDPTSLPPPARIDYSQFFGVFQELTYAPNLRQVFFIGDGLTGTGAGESQQFLVPNNATRLFFGIADSFGFNHGPGAGAYDDNVGAFQVEYRIVPEPSACSLMMISALIGATRRRVRRIAY